MRKFLLDTNVLGSYLRARPGAVKLADEWIVGGEAATSIVIYGEITEYLKGLVEYARYRAALRKLLIRVHPYPLSYPILERYANLRRAMRSSGLIGDIDTLIAATALEQGLTLVTTDNDFTRVPGLLHHVLPLNALK
jgi:predicted nucleic acid-binding protein